MATEIIEGTVAPSEPVRSKRGYLMFDPLQIRDRKGGTRELRKVCCGGAVGEAVRKGGAGRFYVSSGGGQTGIHAVRMDDGTEAYAHYNNMEMVVLLGIGAAMVLLVIGLVTGDMMITPVLIGFLLVGIYFFLRSIRLAGKKQYDEAH